ncbi:MAG: bacillithiol biosynthesis cysteine-adding enzyme BshC [Ignavibacteria bacterium]|nr:bacillithiol biosynthesis cysteine-adding enzyme BshC [Ignavibacteria bacterium]
MFEFSFEEIPGFSKLFNDFLKRTSFFEERFHYLEDLLISDKLIQKKLTSYQNRELFSKIIEISNSNLELSYKQKINLEKINKENTAVVVTGQQPAFFGGPLYIYYKTYTTIKIANLLSEKYPEYNFVPVFWIEDNDHDCIEAFQTIFLDKNYNLVEIPIDEICLNTWKLPLSEYYLSESNYKFLDFYLNFSSFYDKNFEFSKFLSELYNSENSLVKSFKSILNKLFNEDGILFIEASKCRQYKAFKEILYRELDNFAASYSIIETANSLIESQGYHIQAKNSLPNLFFHSNTKRTKIVWNEAKKTFILDGFEVPEDEILHFFESNIDKFSPNVLLRPICQDFLLPNVLSVLGPSEIGYFAQLKELYYWHQVQAPAVIPRHSISFITSKFWDLVETKGFTFFLKNSKEIENFIYSSLRNLDLLETINNLEKEFANIFEKLSELGSKFEQSLIISAEAHYKKSLKNFNSLIAKIFTAEKRNILEKNKEFYQLNNILYPKGSLQERLLGFVFPILLFGEEKFKAEIQPVIERPSTKHYLVIF